MYNIINIERENKQFKVGKFTSNSYFWTVDDWERKTYKIFDELLDKEHSYIDIGAWIGPTVLFGAQKAKHCYAIEPDKKSFSELLFNLYLNPEISKKVTPILGAVNDTNGELRIGNPFLFGDSRTSAFFENEKHVDVTEAFTLDSIIKKYNINDVNFIKMDIEGWEFIVLPGIEQYLVENKINLFLSLHLKFLDKKKKIKFVPKFFQVIEKFDNIDGFDQNPITENKLIKSEANFEILCTWD